MNDLALRSSQIKNPAFRFSRHLLYNLSRPEKSLQLLAPLAKKSGGFGICREGSAEAKDVFADSRDQDYQALLAMVSAGKANLDKIKRFDMPGFQPRPEYLREMKRYGILAPDQPDDTPVEAYELDQRYWKSLWHRGAPQP